MSKTWNSINPATLSGAIDVIVVEQEDGMFTDQVLIRHHLWHCRFACLFSISCPFWQVLVTPTI